SLDLSEDNSCEELLSFVNKKDLTVDILINNAGLGSFGYLREIEVEKELKLIDVNIRSLTELTKLFLPIMISHGEGAIMNVASTAAFCAGPKMATYYASKSYVLNFTEAIYEELKGSGIKVSCLC
ncbi:SDR family NAD(P)-dependent oxidoreductase, partial [Clostridium perfringens]|uniref:SDR family NAD(P)-dependent oxidoreductase n=1 Tax=Clostridium perfringens TaxID=1502 RepID=UPI002AC4D634